MTERPFFVDGEDIDYTFSTDEGPLDVLATVAIVGSTLELRDPAVYSGTGAPIQVGVRQMLQIVRQVQSYASLQGFKKLRLTGKRLSGANPGRAVFYEGNIR